MVLILLNRAKEIKLFEEPALGKSVLLGPTSPSLELDSNVCYPYYNRFDHPLTPHRYHRPYRVGSPCYLNPLSQVGGHWVSPYCT